MNPNAAVAAFKYCPLPVTAYNRALSVKKSPVVIAFTLSSPDSFVQNTPPRVELPEQEPAQEKERPEPEVDVIWYWATLDQEDSAQERATVFA